MTEPNDTPCDPAGSRPAQLAWLMRWLLIPAGIATVAFTMQRSIALIGLDLHHDTLMFDAARYFLHGGLPFQDFFYQYNLGSVFFHAFVLNELGEQIASLKIATAVVYACIAVSIYLCAAFVRNSKWAVAAAIVWSILSPFHMPAMNGYHAWSTVYMMAAVMGGGLCIAIAIGGRTMLWAVLAGVCFNMAFWFKQVAAVQILAVLAWVGYNALRPSLPLNIAHRFRRIFLGITLGGLASSIPFFFYIFHNAIFQDWWRSAFVFNGYFAASGHSSTGAIALVRTFFPVNRELGYVSVVWAMLPLCLIAIIMKRQSSGGERLFWRPNHRSLVSSLFAVLSFSGWFEYFPLAHSFHTHLFMAPMFVLLALQLDQMEWKSQQACRGQWPMIAMLSLTMVALLYQAQWHVRGFLGKVDAPYVVLRGQTPSAGLHLAPDNAISYEKFSSALLAALESAAEPELIPMSVDPLRALLPINGAVSSDFKMGLNWTFPNEIIEPGFNKRLSVRIADRKSPVYADSLIGIPGYVPVALLEMASPMTASHTLYVPSADHQVVEPPVYTTYDEFFHLVGDKFTGLPGALDEDGAESRFTFIKLDNLAGINPEKIRDVHVSIFRYDDIPFYLSKFQYEIYLRAVPGDQAKKMAGLYTRTENSNYLLKPFPEKAEILDIAKFMLSQGTLFGSQNRPTYFTTLGSKPKYHPFLANIELAGRRHVDAIWSKGRVENKVTEKISSQKLAANLLAVPHGILSYGRNFVMLVQIIMKDGTSSNFYIHKISN